MLSAEIIFTDASNLGCGILYDKSWCIVPFTGKYKWVEKTSIQFKELLAIVFCLCIFGSRLAGKCVALNCDNQAICYVLTSGRSKSPQIQALVRAVYYYANLYNMEYRAFHLYTDDNGPADALSRLRPAVFKSMVPGADCHMTSVVHPKLDF